jgi:hypothetical protein
MMKLHQVEAGKTIRTIYYVYGQPIVSENAYVVIGTAKWTDRIACRDHYGDKVWLNPDLDVSY